jgi:hypothetical protein
MDAARAWFAFARPETALLFRSSSRDPPGLYCWSGEGWRSNCKRAGCARVFIAVPPPNKHNDSRPRGHERRHARLELLPARRRPGPGRSSTKATPGNPDKGNCALCADSIATRLAGRKLKQRSPRPAVQRLQDGTPYASPEPRKLSPGVLPSFLAPGPFTPTSPPASPPTSTSYGRHRAPPRLQRRPDPRAAGWRGRTGERPGGHSAISALMRYTVPVDAEAGGSVRV